jgi:hypothetical protein
MPSEQVARQFLDEHFNEAHPCGWLQPDLHALAALLERTRDEARKEFAREMWDAVNFASNKRYNELAETLTGGTPDAPKP